MNKGVKIAHFCIMWIGVVVMGIAVAGLFGAFKKYNIQPVAFIVALLIGLLLAVIPIYNYLTSKDEIE